MGADTVNTGLVTEPVEYARHLGSASVHRPPAIAMARPAGLLGGLIECYGGACGCQYDVPGYGNVAVVRCGRLGEAHAATYAWFEHSLLATIIGCTGDLLW